LLFAPVISSGVAARIIVKRFAKVYLTYANPLFANESFVRPLMVMPSSATVFLMPAQQQHILLGG